MPNDVDRVHQLVADYLHQFDFHIVFSKEELSHWLSPLDQGIESYVVEVFFDHVGK